MTLVVQKYGGTSVADAAKILGVARRIGKVRDSGVEIVSVISAMGDTTNDLVRLAETISPEPDPREMDLLLSTGELVACTLMTMALRTLGYSAISLSGFQAVIHTDTYPWQSPHRPHRHRQSEKRVGQGSGHRGGRVPGRYR